MLKTLKNLLLKTIIAVLVLTNFMRFFILINAYLTIGRMPIFTDGFKNIKTVLFSWQTDEIILLIGHFLNPILLLLLIIVKITGKQWTALIIFIALFIFEIGIRNFPFYEYIMYD